MLEVWKQKAGRVMKLFKRLLCRVVGHKKWKNEKALIVEVWESFGGGEFRTLGDRKKIYVACHRCGKEIE